MGIQFPEAIRRRRHERRRLLHLHRRDRPRRSERVVVGGRAQRSRRGAHRDVRATKHRSRNTWCRSRKGEKLAAWGLTEPGSGSDAAAMRTTAVKDGDGWVLNGSKMFITHGTSADTLVIMAVTDKSKGAKGISAFILERGTSGLARRQEGRQARHARERDHRSDPPELPRSGVAVDRRRRAGLHPDAAGARRRTHRHRRAVGRPRAGRLRSGARYTAERKQFGRAIASFPAIQERLAQHAVAGRSGAAADLQVGVAEGSGPAHDARIRDGEVVLERDRRARRRRLRPDARRLRLREGLSGREVSSATSSC